MAETFASSEEAPVMRGGADDEEDARISSGSSSSPPEAATANPTPSAAAETTNHQAQEAIESAPGIDNLDSEKAAAPAVETVKSEDEETSSSTVPSPSPQAGEPSSTNDQAAASAPESSSASIIENSSSSGRPRTSISTRRHHRNQTSAQNNNTSSVTLGPSRPGAAPVRLTARRQGNRLVFSMQATNNNNNGDDNVEGNPSTPAQNNNAAPSPPNSSAPRRGATVAPSIGAGPPTRRTFRFQSSRSSSNNNSNNNNVDTTRNVSSTSSAQTNPEEGGSSVADNPTQSDHQEDHPASTTSTAPDDSSPSPSSPSQPETATSTAASSNPEHPSRRDLTRAVESFLQAMTLNGNAPAFSGMTPRITGAQAVLNSRNSNSNNTATTPPLNVSISAGGFGGGNNNISSLESSAPATLLGIRGIQPMPDGRIRLDRSSSGDPIILEPNVPVQIGDHRVTATTSGRNNRSISLRVVQVPPLVPKLLPNQSLRHEEEHDERQDKFKCTICLEFMERPVGCGNSKCGSRFCEKCLKRVVDSGSTPGEGISTATTEQKCPTCRTFFTQANITPDSPLQNEMLQQPPVCCKYQECPAQLLLTEVASHEQNCDYAQVSCKYVNYGCQWTGQKRHLDHHERHHCAVARVSALVDQIRELKGELGSQIGMLQQETGGMMRLQAVHSQNLQRAHAVSTSDLWNILRFTYLVVASTPYFIQIKDLQWTKYWRYPETRACIHNALVLLPTMLASAAIGSKAFELFWEHLGTTSHEDSTSSSSSESFEILEEILLYSCVFWIAGLIFIANLVDDKSSLNWREFPLPLVGKQTIMKDALAISSFAIHLVLSDTQMGSPIKSLVTWFMTVLSTILLPTAVHIISSKIGRNPTEDLLPGRAEGPVLFGLRYALVAKLFDITATMDAAIVMTLLRSSQLFTQRASELVMEDCFFEFIPAQLGAAYMGTRLAGLGYLYSSTNQDTLELIGSLFADSMVALLCLLVLNLLCNSLVKFGRKWGEQIYTSSLRYVRPDGMVTKEYTLSEALLLSSWSMSLVLLWKAASS